jgi:hypothetical protein
MIGHGVKDEVVSWLFKSEATPAGNAIKSI